MRAGFDFPAHRIVLLTRKQAYLDQHIDYAAMSAKKNAPRWIKQLELIGKWPAPKATPTAHRTVNGTSPNALLKKLAIVFALIAIMTVSLPASDLPVVVTPVECHFLSEPNS